MSLYLCGKVFIQRLTSDGLINCLKTDYIQRGGKYMSEIKSNTVLSVLQKVKTIELPSQGSTVQSTVAGILQEKMCPNSIIASVNWNEKTASPGTIRVAVNGAGYMRQVGIDSGLVPKDKDWLYIKIDEEGTGYLLSSGPHHLYLLLHHLIEDSAHSPIDEYTPGKIIPVTFKRHRPWYDHFVNQHARTIKHLNHDEYFENLARIGFSHAEVNGLAFPVQFETGPKGEVLHRFYTYCPALDQFVSSRLNKDIYKSDYLRANLNYLKKNAAIAQKYGLTPGLVCFEPRSVPESLLQRYPMLRGARVDHPLRSFQPRYNLSIAHPVVRDHYAEMMEKLLHEVPTLDYISIWSNDSGAGFEYTSSLYVGRNGGGYVIREWKGDKEIAEAAALNLVRYLKLLRDAGRKVNPNFRVVLRFEAFWAELDYIIDNLEEGIDIEFVSLKSRGWGLAYNHPKYADVPEIHQTVLHNQFDEGEKPLIKEFNAKDVGTDVVYAPDVLWNHEPLVGIPFPYLIHEKLTDMAKQDVSSICHLGGITPPAYLRRNINQEVMRACQLDIGFDMNRFLLTTAEKWIGKEHAKDLVSLWKLSDEVFRYYPVPVWIYTAWGVWYRLFIRPLIPNIEAISEKEREYYEDFLISTAHNRARVDFRYDVGFELTDSEKAAKAMERMDTDVFPRLDDAIAKLNGLRTRSVTESAREYFTDMYDRLRALRCWFRNQRNVAAWITGVHGYLETKDPGEKKRYRQLLHDMVLDEIENTRQLLNLWETSDTRWMYYSGTGETTFIYGDNLGELLRKKIVLMTGHENDEPYIDPDFQWRVPDLPWSYKNKSEVVTEIA
jgi:hypothetical protein